MGKHWHNTLRCTVRVQNKTCASHDYRFLNPNTQFVGHCLRYTLVVLCLEYSRIFRSLDKTRSISVKSREGQNTPFVFACFSLERWYQGHETVFFLNRLLHIMNNSLHFVLSRKCWSLGDILRLTANWVGTAFFKALEYSCMSYFYMGLFNVGSTRV